MFAVFNQLLLLSLVICFSSAQVFTTEDINIPSECESIVSGGDHLLLEYEILFANGTKGAAVKRPSQLYHIIADPTGESPIHASVKGMCKGATRRITWSNANNVDLHPLFVKDRNVDKDADGLSVDITVAYITTSEEYQMFSALRSGNMTYVSDLIDNHVGVNAVDEWGQTPLMIAVQMKYLPIIAALLNTRMPKVDVNAAKPSGYTALFYAIEHSSPSIVSALLRRGADPNLSSLQEGSKGNTPLHFACMMEKTKHAELLLEYSANPFATNQYGQNPFQVIPVDAVRSTKLFFKKMFEEAANKIKEAQAAALEAPGERIVAHRTDL